MIEPIDQIIALPLGGHFYLQSVYNDTDAENWPQAGNSYYVGCPCVGDNDATPLPGNQPGQVYPTDAIATLENAADAIGPSS